MKVGGGGLGWTKEMKMERCLYGAIKRLPRMHPIWRQLEDCLHKSRYSRHVFAAEGESRNQRRTSPCSLMGTAVRLLLLGGDDVEVIGSVLLMQTVEKQLSPPKAPVIVSGVVTKGDKDFTPAAAQVAHQKPQPCVSKLPASQHINQHIHQPRK
ncbi:hypothetical protein FQN60_013847 [Etheostoma spectabile]|uniref:Uncharacterized protein n=1 Tax=Etheostoma spectabile TaxID=54343 RepID=A0A5J5CJP7_9PERO|nr:hypothetical protein FQN60_013847 [Etheostoma spectabile]